MSTRRMTKKTALLAAAVVVAALSAGGVFAARLEGSEDPGKLVSAIQNEPVVQVADIAEGNDKPARGVYAQITSTGHFCLWDAPSAESPQRQGGCNLADDPLGGRELSISFAYDGGPAVSSVRDARLIGLASPDVAQVNVIMSDGTRRVMRLRKASIDSSDYLAFGYRLKKADLRRGVTPTAVSALDSGGQEVDRQATGFVG